MPKHPEVQKILDEISEKIQELSTLEARLHDANPGVITCAVIGYETTVFEEDGSQAYRLDYNAVGSGSLGQTLGIVSFIDKQLAHGLLRHGEN